ncbi:MAG TPA: glycine betaine ABC transporter substrate-binding protein, partial [Usitatibacter sp.]|nr:glycine betaine ABC transporter substrate-binding protein [Usitatibacter sp.]
MRALGLLVTCIAAAALATGAGASELRVGSKRFTESYILGELAVQAARADGAQATHRPGMGNTTILVEALRNDAIDVYPEYTGTIAREILKADRDLSLSEINARLAPSGLAAGIPLGFQNTYAIGVRERLADQEGIVRLSDLAKHPDLRLGLSHEFLGRQDGWPGLAQAYSLSGLTPTALDHGLAYEALAAGKVDAVDLYSTDAKIARYGIRVLEDDRRFFPRYDALLLYRAQAPSRHPQAWAAIAKLEGRLDAATMIKLNARAELDGIAFAEVAREHLAGKPGAIAAPRSLLSAIFAGDFGRLLAQHVGLVLASLGAAIVAGVPLGVAAARHRL